MAGILFVMCSLFCFCCLTCLGSEFERSGEVIQSGSVTLTIGFARYGGSF